MGREETETLFKRLRACEDGVFFQTFWTDESHDRFNDDEMAAVAARFGVLTHHVQSIATYPAYVVMLGPCTEVVVTSTWDAPW